MSLLLVAASAAAGEPTTPDSADVAPAQLMDQLRSAVLEGDQTLTRTVKEQLVARGREAVPAIREVLQSKEVPSRIKGDLLGVLGSIPGDESTEALVQSACQSSEPDVSSAALGRLENRPIRFVLSADQIDHLVRRVEGDDSSTRSGAAARVLGKCTLNEARGFVKPVIGRFEREIEVAKRSERFHGVYVSPRVYILNQYLLAFSYMGKSIVNELRDAMTRADSGEKKKWLVLALGMCGDAGVAESVREIVLNDPDPYVRCVSIRAFARSDPAGCVPVLNSLLKDNFESEYYRGPDGRMPNYPIRSAAQGELARMKYEAAQSASTSAPK